MELRMFLQLFILAFVVESLVEYFIGKLFDELPRVKPAWNFGPWKWVQAYVAAAIGLGLAIFYKIDAFPQIGLPGSIVGQALTGLLISRGSNFVNDMFSKFNQSPPPVTMLDLVTESELADVYRSALAAVDDQHDPMDHDNNVSTGYSQNVDK